ncbi:UNVERIFIED_CONTAM: hypothetical protein FKN15_068478 [Acipenser sinensis]
MKYIVQKNSRYKPTLLLSIDHAFKLTKDVTTLSNISCTVHDQDKSRAVCHELTYCPFQEELEKVGFNLHAIGGPRFENYSSEFFLADIVKPEKVQIHKKDEGDKKVVVSWEYPQSWDHPHSYFPLTFEVKALKNKHNCDHDVRSDLRTPNRKVPHKDGHIGRVSPHHSMGALAYQEDSFKAGLCPLESDSSPTSTAKLLEEVIGLTVTPIDLPFS